MWGVNIAILDRYGLSHKRAFGFLKGKGGRGREMNNGTKGGAYDTGDAVNGVEMMSTIKSNNNKNKMRALDHAQSALDALSHLESGIDNDEDQDNLTWINLFSGGVLGASIMFYAYTFVIVLSAPAKTIFGRVREKLRTLLTILLEIVLGARDFVHVFVAGEGGGGGKERK
ncbi:hypothetical protein TrRE_jg12607 [Triparma retinervis]|uniref:Uncharacterized protein n=1 Tax=Triparma retinervis TaxID=2557542 RepID=A0A9W7E885_9STRA|nr:hypothetical protein TrRE_jg12607 [Triparma retinervis]